jgi:4-amino-4-deoxy-L-arabinose transferase-like glycosyltransferase
MMVASLATLLLVWKCARLLDRDPVRAIVLVGLNPIVLLWGLGGVHNDFLTIFFIVLCFYLLLRGGAAGVVPVGGAAQAPAIAPSSLA